ncbi:MAG: hypothetical protein GXP19_03975 [Gammaproteobacteria bacterium]|nr:hypothetical protein [Gammaproteobacteria bacterium]
MNISGLLTGLLMLLFASNTFAVDSYRYLHVTIDTPWIIFIFLLCIIMVPFILSAVLHWHFAGKKRDADVENKTND